MAGISLSWYTSMASIMSHENDLYGLEKSLYIVALFFMTKRSSFDFIRREGCREQWVWLLYVGSCRVNFVSCHLHHATKAGKN